MEKKCFKCGIVKQLDLFYKHSQMGDGHLNKCIECTKKDSLNHRMSNLENVREYDRNRPNAKKRTLDNKLRLQKIRENDPEKYREMERVRGRNYRKKHREKDKAKRAVAYAISTGRIKNPGVCFKCSVECYTEAHHEDYSKPLEVIWLCDTCHKNRHKEIRAEQRSASK